MVESVEGSVVEGGVVESREGGVVESIEIAVVDSVDVVVDDSVEVRSPLSRASLGRRSQERDEVVVGVH